MWCRRFVHAGRLYLYKTIKVVQGMNELICELSDNCCDVCAFAKMVRKSFNEERERATRVGEILHISVCGPVSPPTLHTR